MNTEFIFGAVNDNDDSLMGKTGSNSKFGLNTGNVTKLEFTDTAGKDNGPGNAVDIWVKVGDREYRRRLYETTGSLYGKKNVLVEPGQEGYAELYKENITQIMAVIVHTVKSVGVAQTQIDSAFSTPATSFTEWSKKIISLIPSNFATKLVDVFLEYQWEIADGQDKTYPELPKNMKGGKFLIPSIKPVGKWSEVKDDKGLHYKDDSNNIHPFTRNFSFMESKKGFEQTAVKKSLPVAEANVPTW